MFKQILVPVDGSETAFAAAKEAAQLAAYVGAAAIVVYVIDLPSFSGLGGDSIYGQAEYLKVANAEAHEALTRAQACLEQAGVPVSTLVVQGRLPSFGILQAVESAKADLIVMGSNGRRGLQKLMLGSVTQKVLAESAVPVLVVPAKSLAGQHDGQKKRATDMMDGNASEAQQGPKDGQEGLDGTDD